MSKDWTEEELKTAGKAMKEMGHLNYEEFCEQMEKILFTAYCKDTENNLIKISCICKRKEELEKHLKESFGHLQVITVLSEEDVNFIKEHFD